MTRDPIAQFKRGAYLYLAIAVLLVLVGLKYRYYMCAVPVLIGVVAYFLAMRALSRFFRIATLDREQMRDFQQAFEAQFATHNLPRQVYWLLCAVAEVDGSSGEKERELVRRFVLTRFTDPTTVADLQEWEATRIPPNSVGALAMGLGRMLSPSERETVFFWCCLVAFVDGNYNTEEHILLQQVARSFGLESHHARRIFHQAKSTHLGGGDAGSAGGSRRKAYGAVSDRTHALRILGLEDGATGNEIKKRHRELVREFHPDRHQHLGEVAAREAEGRFREVQAAYELLAG